MRLMTACALTALLAPGALAFADLKEIQQKGTLRVLLAADEQPEMYSLAKDGPPGFEHEILDSFAKTKGLKLEVIVVREFELIIPMLLKGEGDLILGIVDTPSRRQQLSFTLETLPARHLAVNRKPAPPVRSVSELREAHVVLASGTSWAEAAFAAGVKPVNALMVPDLPGVLAALQSGRANASVMSAVDFALAQRRDATLQPGVFIGPPSPAAWGLRKTDPALVAAINDYIFTMRASPAWSQLVTKYFNADALDLFRRARKP
jgi:membrane-bound lytic murein transglycosylase F